MKIVISPAKSLNLEKHIPIATHTSCEFLKESIAIHKVLKKQTPQDLKKLMSISDNLAQLNWQRNQDWHTPFDEQNARPAIYTFDGDVYNGLQIETLEVSKLPLLQDKLRILSGLYGILKPLDLIQPYRLEMGTPLAIGNSKNLYEFWKTKTTKSLNKELQKNELFINLASVEYFSAIDTKLLKVPVITPEFKDYKDGKLKVISFFAKKARGMMVRYIMDNQIESLNDLKQFDMEGYQFDTTLSKENTLVFVR